MADLTTQVLIEIRDEVRKTNERLDQTNERLDQTNARLEHVATRRTEAEIRVSTEIVAVVGAIHELRDILLADRKQAARVEDHELRIRALEQRLDV